MLKKTNYKNKFQISIILSIFTAIVFIFILSMANIFPLGKNTILCSDLYSQYADFLSFYRSSSFSEKIYSFSKGFGGPTTGLIAYYISSPFNLITYLFKPENIELAVFFIILLKFIFMAQTMYWYFCRHYDDYILNGICALIYVFFPQMIRSYFHIMWLDVFAILPLLILATEKIIDDKPYGKKLFIIFYTYSLIANYYITYMASIFIFLYFIYYCLLYRHSFKYIINKAVKMANNVVLSAMLASPLLLTAFIQLFNGKMDNRGTLSQRTRNMFSEAAVVSSVLDCGYLYENLPILFGGVGIFSLILAYFLNNNIEKRKRLLDFILITFLLFSLYNHVLYFVWHTFAWPEAFPFRFMFVWIFMLVYICRQQLDNIGGKSVSKAMLAVGIVYLLAAKCYFNWQHLPWGNMTIIITFISVVIVMCIFVLALRYSKLSKYIFCCFLFINCVINTSYTLKCERKLYNGNESYSYMWTYKDYYLDVKNALSNTDGCFFRVEDIDRQALNKPMGLSYNGINHFSSTFDQKQKDMSMHYGYADTFYGTSYDNSEVLTDSLLGLKYIICSDDSKMPKEYLIEFKGNKKLYKNPYYFPIIYTGDTNNIIYDNNYKNHINNLSKSLADISVIREDGEIDIDNLYILSSKLQSTEVNIIKQDGAYIELTANGNYLLTSIMYDDCWKITVNGKNVSAEKYMEYFISVPLEEGENHVIMKYVPKGLNIGIIFMFSAILIISLRYINKNKITKGI